ncbi:MAG: hypothetical protein QME74_09695, partial [Candidatus Edwardsbacteria bacterium]|nr:hypothetical protein [Candidatus Edwardsbacteria bacterium]
RPPEDIAGIRHPIIGFSGSLDHGIDYDLLQLVAHQHGDKSFVFVGNVTDDARDRFFSIIDANANCRYLGAKQWIMLPVYIREFDIAIIPYRLTDFNRARIAPLKLVEYLAAGKLAVTRFPTAPVLSDSVFAAEDPERFSQAIPMALRRSGKGDQAARTSTLVRGCSWTEKAAQVSELIEAAAARKRHR